MKIHDPPMTFRKDFDTVKWDESVEANQDPYGNAILRFASEWATRMEAVIPVGSTPDEVVSLIKEHAKRCRKEADDEGITGFMYGFAVSMLADGWVYGEQLRRWHNIETQLGTEGERANEQGGTLNPAMLNIEPK